MRLPKPEFKGLILEDALLKRRSVREYTKRPLSLKDLSQLLFAAQGVTERSWGIDLRTAPSAGALYPFEIYIVVNRVEGLKAGTYRYSAKDHSIVIISEGEFSGDISDAALGQDAIMEVGALFVLSAVFNRTRSKYGERGFRYVYMEAGHISQNIYLQAVSLGLGSVMVGAFRDDEVNRLIGVDGAKETVISIHAVGSVSE